jgi:hypothetical protein
MTLVSPPRTHRAADAWPPTLRIEFLTPDGDPKALQHGVALRERHAQLTAPIGTQSHFLHVGIHYVSVARALQHVARDAGTAPKTRTRTAAKWRASDTMRTFAHEKHRKTLYKRPGMRKIAVNRASVGGLRARKRAYNSKRSRALIGEQSKTQDRRTRSTSKRKAVPDGAVEVCFYERPALEDRESGHLVRLLNTAGEGTFRGGVACRTGRTRLSAMATLLRVL